MVSCEKAREEETIVFQKSRSFSEKASEKEPNFKRYPTGNHSSFLFSMTQITKTKSKNYEKEVKIAGCSRHPTRSVH